MLMELAGSTDFFWSPPFWPEHLKLSEWYAPEHRDVFSYFDSWSELQGLADGDFTPRQRAIAGFCERHLERTLEQWRDIFDRVG